MRRFVRVDDVMYCHSRNSPQTVCIYTTQIIKHSHYSYNALSIPSALHALDKENRQFHQGIKNLYRFFSHHLLPTLSVGCEQNPSPRVDSSSPLDSPSHKQITAPDRHRSKKHAVGFCLTLFHPIYPLMSPHSRSGSQIALRPPARDGRSRPLA